MFARMGRFQASPERIQDGVQAFEGMTDSLKGMAGFKGAYLLVDRWAGKAITLTLWENEDSVRASAAASRGFRSQGAEAMGSEAGEAKIYEFALQL